MDVYTFRPGAVLPHPTTQATDQSLIMLEGAGLWRMAGQYHHVQEGDALWTAPYCDHWFVAIGDGPASYGRSMDHAARTPPC